MKQILLVSMSIFSLHSMHTHDYLLFVMQRRQSFTTNTYSNIKNSNTGQGQELTNVAAPEQAEQQPINGAANNKKKKLKINRTDIKSYQTK